jgi:glycosyltransferase involved in cell wall biosynthesis
MNHSRLTVCMATYNGEKYVSEQIHSILKQIELDDELVISDDHSTDDTIAIIKDLADPRIRLIHNDAERGYTRNFENAIRNASGEQIFISDQDDVWLDNKVQVMKEYLAHYDLVVSDATYVNQALEVTLGSHFALTKVKSGLVRQTIRPRYIGACMAFRRPVLEMSLPFPRNAKYCPYDYWLTLVGESCFKVGLVDQPLILYRRHDRNVSPAGMTSPSPFIKKALVRIYSLIALTLRMAARPYSIRFDNVSVEGK